MSGIVRDRAGLLAAAGLVLAAAACGGSSGATGSTSGHAAGTGAGAASGGSGGTGASGAAGGGSGGSATGGGAAGGGGAACLDASAFASLFTIEDGALCAVAMYEASESFATPYVTAAPLAWGSHGGPLELRASAGKAGAVELVRWQPPQGATGSLTPAVTTVDAALPDLTSATPAAYLSQPAVDLPFFGLTAFAWTGAADQDGEIVLVQGTAVARRYATNGTYALAAVGSSDGMGRLLYTGATEPGDTATTQNALYAADSCGSMTSPEVGNVNDPACEPAEVSAWGSFSGPVVTDAAGNAFVVMSSGFMAPVNDARAFAAAEVARGAAPSDGSPLFMIEGTADSVAALAPTAGADGIVAFQGLDGSFLPVDVVGVHYAVSGGKIEVESSPVPLLGLAKAGTPVVLLADDQDRIWAGVPDTMKTTFVVMARR